MTLSGSMPSGSPVAVGGGAEETAATTVGMIRDSTRRVSPNKSRRPADWKDSVHCRGQHEPHTQDGERIVE